MFNFLSNKNLVANVFYKHKWFYPPNEVSNAVKLQILWREEYAKNVYFGLNDYGQAKRLLQAKAGSFIK